MTIHLALYKWKDSATREQIEVVFRTLTALGPKIPGLIGIACAKNESKYNEGYTHVIFVRGKNQTAIDAYRSHPEHLKIASIVESMEDRGIGVDFSIP
ncbi:MAG TPA: Dabb family protein [Candidatus Limnocylindrales bacterium]|nr:Dabb family protein [Candidatus Limnocylindrales bacterium]